MLATSQEVLGGDSPNANVSSGRAADAGTPIRQTKATRSIVRAGIPVRTRAKALTMKKDGVEPPHAGAAKGAGIVKASTATARTGQRLATPQRRTKMTSTAAPRRANVAQSTPPRKRSLPVGQRPAVHAANMDTTADAMAKLEVAALDSDRWSERRRLWDCQEFIANVPLLAPLKKFEKDRLACFLHTVEFTANEIIMSAGDNADAMYFVQPGGSGAICVRPGGNGSNVPIRRYKPYEHFGELALLTGRPRQATIVVIGKPVRAGSAAAAADQVVARCYRLVAEDFHRRVPKYIQRSLLRHAAASYPGLAGELNMRLAGGLDHMSSSDSDCEDPPPASPLGKSLGDDVAPALPHSVLVRNRGGSQRSLGRTISFAPDVKTSSAHILASPRRGRGIGGIGSTPRSFGLSRGGSSKIIDESCRVTAAELEAVEISSVDQGIHDPRERARRFGSDETKPSAAARRRRYKPQKKSTCCSSRN